MQVKNTFLLVLFFCSALFCCSYTLFKCCLIRILSNAFLCGLRPCERKKERWCCALSPNVPVQDSYQASLKRAVKHGLSPLSPQFPAATSSGIHISQLWIFQPWWRGEAIKTSPGFFKSVPFFSSFFSFSVNSIHFGKGSKNTIVARRNKEGEGESIDLHAHIVMDKTDHLLFASLRKKTPKKKTRQDIDFGIKGCSPKCIN